jgi:hypothetical protein
MTDKIANNMPGKTSCTYNPLSTNSWTNNQCGSNYHSCAKVTITGKNAFNSLCTAGNTAFATNSGWAFPKTNNVYSTNENGVWNSSGALFDAKASNFYRSVPSETQCSSSAIAAITSGADAVNNDPTKNGVASNSGSNSNSGGSNAGGVAVTVILSLIAVAVIGVYGLYRSKSRTESFTEWIKLRTFGFFKTKSSTGNAAKASPML